MKKHNLLSDPVHSLFHRYFFPSVAGTLVTAVYILVDTIIIGKGIGSDAVAGLNIVLPLFSVFYGTGMLFGVGGSVLMAVARGQKDQKKASGYFSTALVCLLGLSVVYMVVFLTFFEPVTNFLGASQQTRPFVDGYGIPIVWGAPVFMLSAFLQAFIRNDKSPKTAMAGTITGGVVNIVLDLVFVYVFEWGMFGAAFATVIGNTLGVLVLSSHFFSKHNTLHFRFANIKQSSPGAIIKTGFSSFLIEMSAGIVTFLFNIQLMRYTGVDGVTAYSILSNTAIMLASLCNGVSQAAQPILATNYGAGKTERVMQVRRMGLTYALGIGFVFSAVALLFPDLLINIFIHPTEAVAAIARPAIRIYAPTFFIAAFNLFLANYFQGTLKPGSAMTISLSRGLVLNTVIIFLLPLLLNVTGIWMTIPLTELITAVTAFVLLKKSTK